MPKKVDHAERRALFAKAAFEEIAEKGLGGATLRMIAKRAGFTTGALVHYVQDKDDLLIAASEYTAVLYREKMVDREVNLKGVAALRSVICETLIHDKTSENSWRVIWLGFWQRSQTSQKIREITKIRYQEWHGRLTRLVKEAQSLGEFDASLDASVVARSLIFMIDGMGNQILSVGNKLSVEEQTALVDLLLDRFKSRLPAVNSQTDGVL